MFYGIGVGIGNSQTVTKKAIDVLDELDILYVPTAKKAENFSSAHSIVKDYINKRTIIKARHFPMNYNSEELQKAWNEIASEIIRDVSEGNKVGFVTIGDPMVYSTYIYLLRILKDKIKVTTIPGIASFLDIACNNNFPLVEGEDPLIILPATMGIEKLRNYIKNENSIVLMKVYNNFDEVIKMLIEENLENHSIVVSNSSKNEEVIYENIKDIKKSDVSYFTTILINKRWEI
ncbi:precorrin-2 C(20)-methyltransferase [Sedimentibacter sp. MB31-C6]|uniref:precorrin-2 C(20)-methyltransferase n=1 Tax=Sedimentibacter sp. MB31-C6 TaxID=3109366 RepID=UPI002DDD08AE|nr:precorrin-2 C(20)-methyltransferase [Sedimentibacter sp. MB36-C1]WSI02834.1 precorrin-2 C(20)-methyltransferase [Sedimentibacter sp. MB36-C1]